ncbi:MAG: hypothetical protein K2X82_24350 [Gemmataceae bacterium]|nr:hypothetical protein [Gemmataceae bacterium]
MAVHWSDFPERVERFGDLFQVLETLDRDRAADFFHGGQFDNEAGGSAYHVEPGAGAYMFQPDPDRIPGWDRLATRAEREFGDALRLTVLRAYRGRASEALDVPLAEVDAMSIVAVADALDAADHDPTPAGPGADPLAEYRWLKVTQVARLFATSAGQVSKLCDAGGLVTNGKAGTDRRIDVLSVVKRELDRLARQADPEAAPRSH